MFLRVLDIVDGTIVDGPGLRTSIYVAGCRHKCPGCHNQQSWDFTAGSEMSISQLIDRIRENDMNVTLSGGDPLYQIEGVLELCRQIRSLNKSIWCYTGYTYEEIKEDPKLRKILEAVDVLVDGPFIQAQRDTTLRFRGSSNQRIIDLHQTRDDRITLWEPETIDKWME